MFRSNKVVLFILINVVIMSLSACTLGQNEQPTATPPDVNAVQTTAAGTAQVELTNIAAAALATSTLTATSAVTNTPAQSVTDTPAQAATATFSPGELTWTPTATALTIGGTDIASLTGTPTITPLPTSPGVIGGPVCKNARFDGDITVPDDTQFHPWDKFSKAWSVRNTGTCTWDQGFYFAAISGPPSMTAHPYYFKFKKDFVPAGQAVNIYIDMYAPGDPGEYVAHWHMYDDLGKPFGGDFTVVIKVVK